MRRTEVVLSCFVFLGCTPSQPPPAPAEAPAPTCEDEAEALREALSRIDEAAGPRIAPGPVAPWPAPLDPDLDFAFYIHHEDGQWRNPPFDLSASPAQIQAAYALEQERRPGAEGFLLAADAATPTRELAARLEALERAGVTVGSFNVEVPLAEPLVPPDAQWLEEVVGPRLNAGSSRITQLAEVAAEQLERWEAQCGDLSWTFDLDGVAVENRTTALAQRFADGHRACACQTSATRWAALFHAISFGTQPATTKDGDYRVQLSPKGTVVEFAPGETWGTTIQRFPTPSNTHTSVWLAEKNRSP